MFRSLRKLSYRMKNYSVAVPIVKAQRDIIFFIHQFLIYRIWNFLDWDFLFWVRFQDFSLSMIHIVMNENLLTINRQQKTLRFDKFWFFFSLHSCRLGSYWRSNLSDEQVQVTGRSDIENITAVKLKVHTIQAGLHRLAELTPRLRALTLDDSCVNSLRDLGASLKSLESLSVCRYFPRDNFDFDN